METHNQELTIQIEKQDAEILKYKNEMTKKKADQAHDIKRKRESLTIDSVHRDSTGRPVYGVKSRYPSTQRNLDRTIDQMINSVGSAESIVLPILNETPRLNSPIKVKKSNYIKLTDFNAIVDNTTL